MAHVFEGKPIGSYQEKTVRKGELLIWRTKNQARDQDIDSPTQEGFNLLQRSPNLFLGNCILEPSSKVGLSI
jgi:hypothetical protein